MSEPKQLVTFTALYTKMPSDEILAEIKRAEDLNLKKKPDLEFEEERGKITVELALIDEINEANPRTQSSLHLANGKIYVIDGNHQDILEFLQTNYNFKVHEFKSESTEVA